MTTKKKSASEARIWCGLAIFVGLAACGFANTGPFEDYVADHVFNDGRSAAMEAEARETFKVMHARLARHDRPLTEMESKGSAITELTTPRATVAKQ